MQNSKTAEQQKSRTDIRIRTYIVYDNWFCDVTCVGIITIVDNSVHIDGNAHWRILNQ